MKNLFLSHDWGIGAKNHARVVKLDGILEDYLTTWFDGHDLASDMIASIRKGLEESEKVVIFITRAYMEKASGEGPNGVTDYCYQEFQHVREKYERNNIILVVNDSGARNNRQWKG